MTYRSMTAADLECVIPLHVEYCSCIDGGEAAAFAPGCFEQYDDCFACDLGELAVADERHERFCGCLGYGTAINFVLKTKLL